VTKDHCDVKLIMGNWMIAVPGPSGLHYMYHNCYATSEVYQKAVYMNVNWIKGPHNPKLCWACTYCSGSPPPELEGLYLMLEQEYTYAVMQHYPTIL
jgi:hypothetical protein